MKVKATAPIIIIGFIVILFSFVDIFALDSPHNKIGTGTKICEGCHAEGLLRTLTSPFWGGSENAYDLVCQYCHTESSCGTEYVNGPSVKTHSRQNTDPENKHGYGEWAMQCRNCHNPHYERQKNYKNTDAGNLYLATGTIKSSPPPSYNSTENKTTLYYTSITYKSGWNATKLTEKTGACRRTILFPNVGKLGYNYPVIAVDTPTAGTITVTGDATAYLSPPTTFAVIYGQYIKDSILTNEDTGTYSTVKFFDKEGTNSFADGDATYNGVCEVCHTQTKYFTNTGGVLDQIHTDKVRTNCTNCHSHVDGFKPSCKACHGYPPTVNTPESPDGLAWVSPHTGSTTAGAHILHATTKGYQCSMCHYNSVGSGTTHNNNIITLGFVNLPGVHTGGSYDGQISANYQRSDLGTTVTKNGSKECSNIYCHGSTMAPNGGTDITPIWDQPSTGACGTCHGATPANPPTSGSHSIHAGSAELVCSKCHNNYESMHVDGGVHIEPGSGVSFTPEDDSCSNISCHSNTEAEWGKSACLYCHSISINNRAAITPQFNENSHHIQGVEVTGAHCYQCHWEANADGTINHTYHGGSKAPGSPVDLVIYGNGSRPSNDSGTVIHYVADGSRAQIQNINTHCLSCHSTQNNSITLFGDGKTPKQYAWDGTSVDGRYSQTGTATWNKYAYGSNTNTLFLRTSLPSEPKPNLSASTDSFAGGTWEVYDMLPSIGTDEVSRGKYIYITNTGTLYWRALSFVSPEVALSTTIPAGTWTINIWDGEYTYDANAFMRATIYVWTAGDVKGTEIVAPITCATELWNSVTGAAWKYNCNVEGKAATLNQSDRIVLELEIESRAVKTPQGWKAYYFWNGKYGDSNVIMPTAVQFGPSNNFTPKQTQTKAYSAHGKAVNNQGGWDLDETWPNTRAGAENVACFDCHNSHGSSVSGITTSYTSATTNGGILKDVEAGKGGYSSLTRNYKPQAGGSTTDKNAYNAGAGLCFDCHMNATAGTTPWGYNSTFGATQAIMGYWDTPYFGPGTFASQQRYSYKINPHQGGHFGASSTLSSPPTETINSLCTPCHDPHGVSPTLDPNMQYSVPLLKGTWLTSPYKEDTAPANNVAGTARTGGKGGEGIKFYIDQNTFGYNIFDNVTGIPQSADQFAGLCLKCHSKSSLTNGTTHNWKGKDRIHESVKGWKTTPDNPPDDPHPIWHNYPCSKCHTPHNSRLPRLMVTNCLDGMHKGRVGKNPSRVIKGDGSGNGTACAYCAFPDHVYGVNCGSFCSGLSGTIGGCYDEWWSGSGSGGIGSGNGYLPGVWNGTGKHVGGEHISANTCHVKNPFKPSDPEYQSWTPDQRWNNVTQWSDETVSITKGPEAGSFKVVGSGPYVQATITWETASQYSTSYVEYGLTLSYGSTEGNDTMVKNHSITLTNLTNHSTYHYKVCSSGYCSGDNIFYISVPPSIPSTQFGSTLCSSSSCPITLKWNASTDPDSGPIQYYVEVGTDWYLSSINYVLDWTPEETNCVAGQCSWTFNAYKPEHWYMNWYWYYWRVKARDGNHTEAVSDWSPVSMFTIYNPPDAPTLIHEPDIVSTEPVSITLEWIPSTSPNGGSLEYFVQVNNASDFNGPNNFTSNWISEETLCDWGEYRWTKCRWPVPIPLELDTGTKWYWRVQARVISYPDDPSQWSVDSFTIMSSNPPPAPTLIPQGYHVSLVPLDVTLRWNPAVDPDGDPVEYHVWVDDNEYFDSPIESDWITGTSWLVTLDPGKTWYWTVQARDKNHPEAVSANWATPDSFIIMSSNPPSKPELIDEPNYDSGGSNTAITLKWNRVTDPDGDSVEYYLEVLDDWDMGNYAPLPWFTETVDSGGNVGEYASIAKVPWSPANKHISYYDAVNGNLKYATNASGSWVTETVDSTGDVGKYSSIGVDDSEDVHISYYDSTNGDLKYATKVWGSWDTETIDSGGDVGKYSSITVDYSDNVHITYYDATNGALKYATNFSGSWVSETIDSGGVGEYTSLTVDWDGNAYISYYDSVNGNLKYATNASGSWVTEIVNSGGDVGKYSSIALDDFDDVHISYYDATNGALKYATNFSGSWVSETIDSGGVGEYSSLVVDWFDYLHISYYDSVNGNLKYATNFSGSWVTETIDSGGDVGKYSSITVEYPANVHISYYDANNTDLKYANPSGWMPDEAPQCIDTKCSWTVILPSCDWSSYWSWRVRARDAAHKDAVSPWSDSDIFYDTSCTYEQLDAPVLIPEPDVFSSVPVAVTLEWTSVTSPDYHTVEYWVEVDDNEGFTSPADSRWISEDTNCNYEGSRCNWTVTLDNDKTWYWRVKARDRNLPDTESLWSTTDSFIISPPPPDAPTLSPEPDISSNVPVDITLDWNAVTCPDGHAVEYLVEVDRDTNFNTPDKQQSAWTTVRSWKVTLSKAITWYWRVKARDAVHTASESLWSTPIDSFIIYGPPDAPTLSPEPDISSNVPVDITLDWNAVTCPDGHAVEYLVEVDRDTNFNTPDKQQSVWITNISQSFVLDPIKSRTWYWRVKARDAGHTDLESSWSTVDSFIIYGPPDAPTLSPEPDISSTVSLSVTLQWNAVICPDGHTTQYYVEVDDASDFSSPTSSNWISGNCVSNVCSWTVIPQVPPGYWYWRVKARDSVHTTAESSWSTVDSFAINLIDESFENPGTPGYDNAPWDETGNPNENSALPASLTGAGSQCLQSISASTNSYRALTRKDLGSGFEQTRTYTSFYLYVGAEGLADGNYKRMGALENSAYSDVVVFRLNKTGTELRLYLRLVYNNGSSYIDDYVVINTGNWHRIEVKYDNSTGTAYSEWWVDGVYQGGSTLIPSQTHYNGIQRWELGFGNTGQAYTGTIYFDLIKVNTLTYQ